MMGRHNDRGGMQTYDVIVIGSGTGGQTAAYDLADAGLNVALVDNSGHPGGICALAGCQAKKWFYETAEVDCPIAPSDGQGHHICGCRRLVCGMAPKRGLYRQGTGKHPQGAVCRRYRIYQWKCRVRRFACPGCGWAKDQCGVHCRGHRRQARTSAYQRRGTSGDQYRVSGAATIFPGALSLWAAGSSPLNLHILPPVSVTNPPDHHCRSQRSAPGRF